MTRKYFGTDGVRGKVGTFPITPSFAMKLGWAAGTVLASSGTKEVLIGKDTRSSGYMLESAIEAGLSAAGINVALRVRWGYVVRGHYLAVAAIPDGLGGPFFGQRYLGFDAKAGSMWGARRK